jgi:hypothetical protein
MNIDGRPYSRRYKCLRVQEDLEEIRDNFNLIEEGSDREDSSDNFNENGNEEEEIYDFLV